MSIRVTPGARQERLAVDADGAVRLAVRASATEGKANRAVCAAIAAWLDVPPSSVRIIRGATSRQKAVEVVGLGAETLAARARALAATPAAPRAASPAGPEAE